MGNIQSYDPSHVRIYNNLLAMNSASMRVQMLETLLVAPEYVASARRSGIYAGLLGYIRSVRSGEAGVFPGVATNSIQGPSLQSPASSVMGLQSPAAQAAAQLAARGSAAAASALQAYHEPQRPAWQVVAAEPTNKALNYFQKCLQVLGLNEDESLTEEALKVAYKRAAIRAHPDKGGNEQLFEAVTRAYAYLSEILQRVKGTKKTTGALDAPAITAEARTTDAKRFEHVQPVRIDPKNVNMTSFNQMFEQTRLPDPDDDGYGDWLKDQEAEESAGNKFSGKFNRDVFMRTFEEEAKRKAASTAVVLHPELMALNSSANGVTLGRSKAETFTAPANASMQYTDLRDAYTKENTITNQVANVRVEERNMKEYQNQYKKGPAAMTAQELAQMEEERNRLNVNDIARQRRAAEEAIAAQQYFDKMKQLVLTK
jgi:curved DNA-binding protein CbpA